MDNTINGRTPEEIKAWLNAYIALDKAHEIRFTDRIAGDYGEDWMWLDDICRQAVDCIQQLERERDAAVKDLKSVVASNYFDGDYCKLCKYKEPDGECYHTCIPYSSEWGWEWRGVEVE